jgi:hypothetical protein
MLLFAGIILLLIVVFYKFKPESMNTQSILFADNMNIENSENFTDIKPTMTFYTGDKQPVYSVDDVNTKINDLDKSIKGYNDEVLKFNNFNDTLDNNYFKIFQPYDDINSKISKKIDNIKTNVIAPQIEEQRVITKHISELQYELNELENKILKDKILEPEPITAQNIKSLDNGMELSVYHDNNTNFYNISVNNGCLTTTDNGYMIEPCNINDKRQKFEMENIFNDIEYTNNISPVFESTDVPSKGINYPFVMMKSVNNLDCLTNNHGEISVQPCNISKKQRWIALQNSTGKCATV